MRLVIQSMKNEVYSQGHTVDMMYVSGSGVEKGVTIKHYLASYDECSLPPLSKLSLETPLFLPSHPRGDFYFTPGLVSCFASVIKDVLPLVFAELAQQPAVLAHFSFHSLHRGGGSWAYRQGVQLKLIMGHWRWHSKQGIAPYLVADLNQRLGITLAM